MPRIVWPLLHDRPLIEVVLTQAVDGQSVTKHLLADTGAGSAKSVFELLMEENNCLTCGGTLAQEVKLKGAYEDTFRSYVLRVRIPALGFEDDVLAVAVPPPDSFDGIACFRFLNRFAYGNFGNPTQFGLETP